MGIFRGSTLSGDALANIDIVADNIDNVNTVGTNIASVNAVATDIADVSTVAGITADVGVVASIAAEITAVDANETNITTVAGIDADVTTVAGISSNVTTVAGMSANISSIIANETNINTVAADIADVAIVADDIASVIAVAAIDTDVTAVAAIDSDVTTVAGIAADVTAVAAIDSDVTTVATNDTNVTTVATDISNVNAVGSNISNVNAVAGNATNINAVAADATDIGTVATNIANVNSVGTNIANVNSVAGNSTNINAVAGNATNINTVAGISGNVTTVATNNANVTTVAGSIANVNTVAGNISNVNQVASDTVAINAASANATAAANSATAAATSATNAATSAAQASAVALGNEPVRHSVRPSLLLDFANTKTLDPRITFTRGSTATFYDGKTVAKAEENLFLYSEQFDNATWAKSGGATPPTVTANTSVAPDGNTTADTYTRTVTGEQRLRYTTAQTTNVPYTLSVFAKAGTASFLRLRNLISSTETNTWFNLSTGAVGTISAGTSSATITSFGNGWYRCSITVTTSAIANNLIDIASATSDAEVSSGTAGETLLLWGAQLEQRSSVTAYTATTTAPITNYIPALQTAAAGVARFEHNPVTGESLGLEIEEQRTNLVVRSEEFGTTWTATNITVTANQIIAPDGTLTADQLTDNSTSGFHQAGQTVSLTSGTTYTLSVYAKRGTTNVSLRLNDGTNFARADFDLSNGTSTLTTGTSASITAVGNGWYRCTLTGTATATTASGSALVMVKSIFSYVGTGEYVYVWGAQLEAGAFATSYIKTEGSQVTRSADSASMTGTNFSSWYRADEGTLYSQFVIGPDSDGSRFFANIDDGGNTNAVDIRSSNIATIGGVVGASGGQQANMSVTAPSIGSTCKAAITYKVNDFAFTANAATVVTDTSGTVPTNPNRFTIGSYNAGSGNFVNTTIAKVAYYAKRLTNSEIQALTTI